MIDFAQNTDFNDLVQLWKICFPTDSECFVDMYFREKYKKEYTLVYRFNNRVIAAIQMLPYTMTFFGKKVNIVYISGAATLPEFRGEGLMKSLLQKSFIINEQNNIAFSVLIPQEKWLVNFYNQLGYIQAFGYQKNKVFFTNSQASEKIFPITDNQIALAYQFYNEHSQKRDFCIQKTIDDFKVIFQDYRLAKGNIFALKTNEQISALAFCSFQNGDLIVKELLTNHKNKELILNNIMLYYQIDNLYLFQPTTKKENYELLGMWRVTNAEIIQDCLPDKLQHKWKEHSDIELLFKTILQLPFMSLMLD